MPMNDMAKNPGPPGTGNWDSIERKVVGLLGDLGVEYHRVHGTPGGN